MPLSSPTVALDLRLRPSLILIVLTGGMHLGAMVLLSRLALPWLVNLVLMILLISHFLFWLKGLPGQRGAANLRRLIWGSEGAWLLETNAGVTMEAYLDGPAFVHPWLVILRFRGDTLLRRYMSVVLLPDSLDREIFRALRVRLRIEGTTFSGIK